MLIFLKKRFCFREKIAHYIIVKKYNYNVIQTLRMFCAYRKFHIVLMCFHASMLTVHTCFHLKVLFSTEYSINKHHFI